MRIAWFSPLPPNRSGIAAYCAELLPLLSAHEIEAFVDDSAGRDAAGRTAPIAGIGIRGAHDFPWRHARRPYDAVVYHVGNDASHDYLWPCMVRYPPVFLSACPRPAFDILPLSARKVLSGDNRSMYNLKE